MASKKKIARSPRYSNAEELRAAMVCWARDRWTDLAGRAPAQQDEQYFREHAQPYKQTHKSTERRGKAVHTKLVSALREAADWSENHQHVVGWEGAASRLGKLARELVDPKNGVWLSPDDIFALHWQRELNPDKAALSVPKHKWPGRKVLIQHIFNPMRHSRCHRSEGPHGYSCPAPCPHRKQGWRFTRGLGHRDAQVDDVVMVCLLAGLRDDERELASLWHQIDKNPTRADGLNVERKAVLRTIEALTRPHPT